MQEGMMGCLGVIFALALIGVIVEMVAPLIGLLVVLVIIFIPFKIFVDGYYSKHFRKDTPAPVDQYKTIKEDIEEKEEIYIDSNIWMDSDLHTFFLALHETLKKAEKRLVIPGQQYDEFRNIKSSSNANEERKANARLAIRRLEELQKDNLLSISNFQITPRSKEESYLDPFLVDALIKSKRSSLLLTNDRELRIIVREMVTSKRSDCKVSDVPKPINYIEIKPEVNFIDKTSLVIGHLLDRVFKKKLKSESDNLNT